MASLMAKDTVILKLIEMKLLKIMKEKEKLTQILYIIKNIHEDITIVLETIIIKNGLMIIGGQMTMIIIGTIFTEILINKFSYILNRFSKLYLLFSSI